MAKKTSKDMSLSTPIVPTEELPTEAPTEEDMIPEDTEAVDEEVPPVATVMTHTIDELPMLGRYAVGDELVIRIADVSDDGKTYSLEFTEPTEPEMSMGEQQPTGRAAIAGGLI